jgi:hypothetical protein
MVRSLLIGDVDPKYYYKANVFEPVYVWRPCGQRHDGSLLDINPDFF